MTAIAPAAKASGSPGTSSDRERQRRSVPRGSMSPGLAPRVRAHLLRWGRVGSCRRGQAQIAEQVRERPAAAAAAPASGMQTLIGQMPDSTACPVALAIARTTFQASRRRPDQVSDVGGKEDEGEGVAVGPGCAVTAHQAAGRCGRGGDAAARSRRRAGRPPPRAVDRGFVAPDRRQAEDAARNHLVEDRERATKMMNAPEQPADPFVESVDAVAEALERAFRPAAVRCGRPGVRRRSALTRCSPSSFSQASCES